MKEIEKQKRIDSLLFLDRMRHNKQELILFVESNMKKRDKQTRNDSCYCPPRTHMKRKKKMNEGNRLQYPDDRKRRQSPSSSVTERLTRMYKILLCEWLT